MSDVQALEPSEVHVEESTMFELNNSLVIYRIPISQNRNVCFVVNVLVDE